MLEYSCWPGAQMAEELIILGEHTLDADSKHYLAILRKRFSLPIEYQQFVRDKLVSRSNGRVKAAGA